MQNAFKIGAIQQLPPLLVQSNLPQVLAAQSILSQNKGQDNQSDNNVDANNNERKILLVEDNLINQKVALKLLAQHGLKADTAMNGKEALEKFENQFYDLVLMDIQMPIMDGIEATRGIRKQFGPGSPYIIAVTANVTENDRKNCFDAGMNDFVTKPIRADVLAAAISKAPLPKSA